MKQSNIVVRTWLVQLWRKSNAKFVNMSDVPRFHSEYETSRAFRMLELEIIIYHIHSYYTFFEKYLYDKNNKNNSRANCYSENTQSSATKYEKRK